MSQRPTFLFLTLVVLVILAVTVVLDWGAEAAFFLTWLFVALSVQHDSRLSPAMGLVFLATCPFLLIAEREATAELAANYAFFFLAIGVLVQFEELLLERRGWLERRLDLSSLWLPMRRLMGQAWSWATEILERLQAVSDRPRLVRLVQILGTLGLCAVFMWAAFSGARAAVVLPLLGAALLFPFVVWGLRLIARALGPAHVARLLLVAAVLPLAALELIWLAGLVKEDRLARMETTYDLVESVGLAERSSPVPEGEAIEARVWTIATRTRPVLYQHPAFSGSSRLAYRVEIAKGSILTFAVATAPESWIQPGDGVTFSVYIESQGGLDQVFSTYIDPKQDESDRRWHPYTVDLSAYTGQTVSIILETGAGPAGDYRYDWAGWGEPRLLAP